MTAQVNGGIQRVLIGGKHFRPLDIPRVQDKINSLTVRAWEQLVPEDQVKEMADRWTNLEPIFLKDEFTLDIPLGWKANYTVEMHKPGPIRHLIVWREDEAPINPQIVPALYELCAAFGFSGDPNLWQVHPGDDFLPGGPNSWHFVFAYDGDPMPFLKADDDS